MDVSNLLTDSRSHPTDKTRPAAQVDSQAAGSNEHLYNTPTSGSAGTTTAQAEVMMADASPHGSEGGVLRGNPDNQRSASGQQPKHVNFHLMVTEDQRGRLPMRVHIWPHDTTQSIMDTIRNFFGLYEDRSLSIEDTHGYTLIAAYNNFTHNMEMNVRVGPPTSPSKTPRLDPPFQMQPAAVVPNRSVSPQSARGSHRGGSKRSNGKAKVANGSFADGDTNADHSDSDGGNASVTSSRRSKGDFVASADITVENIVEGGRRKRTKFDSSVSTSFHFYLRVVSLMILLRSQHSTSCSISLSVGWTTAMCAV